MKALSMLILFCLVSFGSYAQFNKKNNRGSNSAADLTLRERIFFGGGGSFSTGSSFANTGLRYTYIALSPLIGYRVTMPYSVGVQVLYQAYLFPQGAAPSINQFGIAPFMQYRIGQFYLYGEFQMINSLNAIGENRSTYKRLPVGLGITQPMGQRAAVNVVVLYDLLYASRDFYAPYTSPIIFRIYFTAGGISF